jgi:hypothetical protein
LGIDNKHAQRLRMGIAELRAFGISAPQSVPAAPSGVASFPRAVPSNRRPPAAPRMRVAGGGGVVASAAAAPVSASVGVGHPKPKPGTRRRSCSVGRYPQARPAQVF